MDPKLVELGIIPSLEVAKAEYNSYIRNGLLVQLTRIKFGDRLEESHMRNRQTIAAWAYEQGKEANVIEKVHLSRRLSGTDDGVWGKKVKG